MSTINFGFPTEFTSYVKTQQEARRGFAAVWTQINAVAASVVELDSNSAPLDDSNSADIPAPITITAALNPDNYHVSTGKLALSFYVKRNLTNLTAAMAELHAGLVAEGLNPSSDFTLAGNTVNHTNLRITLKNAFVKADAWLASVAALTP